jgi:hypothetical protein
MKATQQRLWTTYIKAINTIFSSKPVYRTSLTLSGIMNVKLFIKQSPLGRDISNISDALDRLLELN